MDKNAELDEKLGLLSREAKIDVLKYINTLLQEHSSNKKGE